MLCKYSPADSHFPFRIVHPIILYHTLISDENLLEAILIQNSDNVLISDDTRKHSIDKTWHLVSEDGNSMISKRQLC